MHSKCNYLETNRDELNRIEDLGFWNSPGEGEIKEIMCLSARGCECVIIISSFTSRLPSYDSCTSHLLYSTMNALTLNL